QLPTLIPIVEKGCYGDVSSKRVRGFFSYFFGAVAIAYLSVTYHWFKAMFEAYSYDAVLANVGWVINFAGAVTGLGILMATLKEKRLEKEAARLALLPENQGRLSWEILYELKYGGKQKSNRPNIIIEFFKAKYKRYCPQIDWE